MKKIIPLLMLLLGTGAGVGAGVYLRPDPGTEDHTETQPVEEQAETHTDKHADDGEQGTSTNGKEYLKLSNQFVVPIVEKDRISSMVVMTLSVEVPEGRTQTIHDIEPKIRDVFLRVLFDYAAIGGFRGAFLNNENLDAVRRNLKDAARENFPTDLISDVLIFEIARQDY